MADVYFAAIIAVIVIGMVYIAYREIRCIQSDPKK